MNGIKKIALALGFTRKRSEFELLETEKGAPGFFGGWRYAEEQRQEEKQTVAPSFSENIGRIKESFRADINPDIIIRRFAAGGRVEAAVIHERHGGCGNHKRLCAAGDNEKAFAR